MLTADEHAQEFEGGLKIVKVEADPCPNLVEKYKVISTFCTESVRDCLWHVTFTVPDVCSASCVVAVRPITAQGQSSHPRILVQVYGLPTLVLFKDGEVVKGSQKEGALGKPVILKYLESYGVQLPQTAK